MKVLVVEYAVATGLEPPILYEGLAMLSVLVRGFVESGCEVSYLTRSTTLRWGTPVQCDDGQFEHTLRVQCGKVDAALVIAPDELLAPLTEVVEEKCLNLGCSSACVDMCADKLAVFEALKGRVPTCEPWDGEGPWVSKPRFGCASEGVMLGGRNVWTSGEKWKLIRGKSVSMGVVGSRHGMLTLPLSLQRVHYVCDGLGLPHIDAAIEHAERGDVVRIEYGGSVVPHSSPMVEDVAKAVREAYDILGCEGYVGMDVVLADEPYIVDVNPRPTTSVLGLDVVCTPSVGQLILSAKLSERFGELPEHVDVSGRMEFSKEDIPLLLQRLGFTCGFK